MGRWGNRFLLSFVPQPNLLPCQAFNVTLGKWWDADFVKAWHQKTIE